MHTDNITDKNSLDQPAYYPAWQVYRAADIEYSKYLNVLFLSCLIPFDANLNPVCFAAET